MTELTLDLIAEQDGCGFYAVERVLAREVKALRQRLCHIEDGSPKGAAFVIPNQAQAWFEKFRESVAERDALQRDLDASRAALAHFGRHHISCAAVYDGGMRWPCTCGFTNALNAAASHAEDGGSK